MRGAHMCLSSPDDSPPEKRVQGDTGNEQEGQKMVLPLRNVPPEPAPPLHPLPSPSSYQSPQTTTLAARGKRRASRGRKRRSARKSVAVCTGACVGKRRSTGAQSSQKHLFDGSFSRLPLLSSTKICQEPTKPQAQCQAL